MPVYREDPFCQRRFRHHADCGLASTWRDRRRPLAMCERRTRAVFQRPDQLLPGSSRPPPEE